MEYVLSGLEVDDKWVRVLALEVLGTVGDKRVIPAVRALLADEDPDIRLVASRVFHRIGVGRIEQVIQPPGNCSSCLIRLVAQEALRNNRDRRDPMDGKTRT